jgi:predicted anti-sigma-YlaC factor YlaD
MNCKKATQLLSLQLDEPLAFMDTAKLKFHLKICRGCSAFSSNISLIKKAAQHFENQD